MLGSVGARKNWSIDVKKPARQKKQPEAMYPTLEDFSSNRRSFLKDIASGALYIGLGGALAGCLDNPDSDGRDGGRGGGSDAGVDSSFFNPDDGGGGVDAEPDEGPMAEMGGVARMDVAFAQVRLPASGFAEVYTNLGDYTGDYICSM